MNFIYFSESSKRRQSRKGPSLSSAPAASRNRRRERRRRRRQRRRQERKGQRQQRKQDGGRRQNGTLRRRGDRLRRKIDYNSDKQSTAENSSAPRKGRKIASKEPVNTEQKEGSIESKENPLRVLAAGARARQGRKLRRFWRDGEEFRAWKRRKSVQLLLEQPRAQLAVNQLWQQLILKVGLFW